MREYVVVIKKGTEVENNKAGDSCELMFADGKTELNQTSIIINGIRFKKKKIQGSGKYRPFESDPVR